MNATSYPYGSSYYYAGALEFTQAKYVATSYFAYAADLESTFEPTEPPPTEPAEEECIVPPTEAPVTEEPAEEECIVPPTEAPVTEDPTSSEESTDTEATGTQGTATSEELSDEPSYSVSVFTSFSELTVADWTDEVEAEFVAAVATTANLALNRVEVISVTSSDVGIDVEVKLTDFTDEAEAGDVAALDYIFPDNFGAAETEVDAVVATSEEPEAAPTYSVSVSATLADVSLSDWTPDVESVFLSALATTVDVAVNRFEVIAVISSEVGGIDVQVEVTDLGDIEQANSLATLDYEFPEEFGAVETEVGTPVEIEVEAETDSGTSMYTPLTYPTDTDSATLLDSGTLLGQSDSNTDETETEESSLSGLTTEIMFDVGHQLDYFSVSVFVICLRSYLFD